MKPLIYAHRGSSANAPENTMRAFQSAIEEGADGIELDVHMTLDGRIVVIHDETLDRTTGGKGLVCNHRYDEIKPFSIPLLEEVFELIAPTRLELNIELKNGIIPYKGLEEEVIRLVREYELENRVILSTFNHYSVVHMAKIAPDIETAILYVAGLYQPWKYAREVGARSIHPYFYSVTTEIVQEAHKAGIKVRPYTVDEERDIRRMIECGVDAIITNYPTKMKEILNA